jgi:hypothetical protein
MFVGYITYNTVLASFYLLLLLLPATPPATVAASCYLLLLPDTVYASCYSSCAHKCNVHLHERARFICGDDKPQPGIRQSTPDKRDFGSMVDSKVCTKFTIDQGDSEFKG